MRTLGAMKSLKLSFDFRDRPQLVERLRTQALREGTTQKAIVMHALDAYFAHTLETTFILKATERSFQEWDNEDDQVYDSF